MKMNLESITKHADGAKRLARRVVGDRVYDFVTNTVPEKLDQYTNVEKRLRRLVGDERAEKIIDTKTYRWIADGAVYNIFSFPVYGANDRYVAGHTWWEVAGTRVSAFFGNFVVARPFGVYNDMLLDRLGVKKGKHGFKNTVKRYGVNTLAFGTGQAPIYGLYLIAGAMIPGILKSALDLDTEHIGEVFRNINWNKIRDGAAMLTFAAPVLGGPQRWVYERVRKRFGVKDKSERTEAINEK